MAGGLATTARWAALLIVFVLGLATTGRAGDLPDDVVAKVDGEPIQATIFEAFFRQHARSQLYHAASGQRLAELRREAADLFIDRYLIAREGARRGIDATAGVEQELAAIKAKYKDSADWPAIEPQLPEIRRQVADSIRIDRLKQEIERVREPSEAELRRFYKDNRGLFTEPEQFRLKVILKLVSPSATAEEWDQGKATCEALVGKLATGTDFAQLAMEYSDHESAKKGGDLGFVHKGQLSDEAQAAVIALKAGQVSPPVRVLEGYALFRLDERLPEQLHPLAEVRERALDLYRRDKAARQWKQFVAGLRADARIEVNKAVIAGTGGEDGTGE